MVAHKWESLKTLEDGHGNMVVLCRRVTNHELCLLVKFIAEPVVHVFLRDGKLELTTLAGNVIAELPVNPVLTLKEFYSVSQKIMLKHTVWTEPEADSVKYMLGDTLLRSLDAKMTLGEVLKDFKA